MKAGRSTDELMLELERQKGSKRDFVAPRGALNVARTPDGNSLGLIMGNDLFPMRPTAVRQLGEHLKFPAQFYDRLMAADHGDLVVQTVNRLLHDDNDEKRMVRTLDGEVRAMLSKTYRPLDNYDMAMAVLPVLEEAGAELRSCEVTERKLYLKAVVPGLKAEIPPPGVKTWEWGKEHHAIDVVEAGVEIGNSETGFGSLYTAPGVHTMKCSNLMVFNNDKMRKTHLGKAFEEGDLAVAMSERSRRLADATMWSALADLVRASLDGTLFHKYVEQLRVARGETVAPLQAGYVIEEMTKTLGLTEPERHTAMGHFIEGGDLTRYGVSAAITRTASDIESYDRSSELERMGGKVIELKTQDWQVLLDQAA